jgi:hypothetical protein
MSKCLVDANDEDDERKANTTANLGECQLVMAIYRLTNGFKLGADDAGMAVAEYFTQLADEDKRFTLDSFLAFVQDKLSRGRSQD